MILNAWLPLAFATTEVAAVALQPPSNDGFISFPIQRKQRVRSLSKRDAYVPLYNISLTSYLLELSIGTPAQTVKVAIDTGSDELWVDPDCSSREFSQTEVRECESNGSYDPSSSSTGTIFSNGSSIQYGTGEVTLRYVKDTVALTNGSATMSNVQFGVATSTTDLNEGILGLGWGNGVNLNYSNFVDALAEQKVTNSKAFSVALGSASADNGGVVIFGGIDTKKFTGSLVSNKMLGPQNNENGNRYWIQMTGVGFQTSSGSKTYSGGNTPIILDTGSTFSYLPSSVVTSMASDLGATYNSQADLYLLRCSSVDQSSTVNFEFNGITIKIPTREFVVVADTAGQFCAMGALPSQNTASVRATSFLLGDSFLRSAYVVFDQTQNTISLAQYANCGQSEQSIPASGVGSVSGACDSSSSSSSSSSKNAAGRVQYGAAGLLLPFILGLTLAL